MERQVFVIDFETTDVDSSIALPCEIGLITPDGVEIGNLINPGVPIPAETSAVHGIIDEDVVDAPSVEDTWKTLVGLVQSAYDHQAEKAPVILVAHNCHYEQGILRDVDFEVPVQWICTYKSALRIWPEFPQHKNETLRHLLKLPGRGRKESNASHTALHDTKVTKQIFEAIMASDNSPESVKLKQLIEWSSLPAKLPRMPMGKHRGQTWDTVPVSYMQWMISQQDMSDDLKWNAKEELKRRNLIR